MKLSRIPFAVLISLTVLSRVAGGPPLPTELSELTFVTDYYEKVSTLLKSTVCNHRTKATYSTWDPLQYNKAKPFEYKSLQIFGDHVFIANLGPLKDDGTSPGYEFMTEDVIYDIRRNESGSGYKIGKHMIEWEDSAKYLLRFKILHAVKAQVFLPYEKDQFVSSADDVFEGRKAIKLEFTDSRQIPLTVYLDKETHQFLYSEKPRSYDMATQKVKDEKLIARTTYKEVGGKRLPERYDEYKLTAKGEKLPQHVIEFTEYTPYTPTADELDMEKRFGVKPIPHGPRPDSARPGSKKWPAAYWWYVAGGVVVLAAIAVLVVSRLRRKRT
jgi:hypothetical protein